jgi:MFS-type transporter involved in bile tolerance (Atg22 family)
MEPIISPWIIYLVCVASAVRDIAMIALLLSSITTLVVGIGASLEDDAFLKKIAHISFIVGCVSAIFVIFIPSKDTLLAMVVMQYITSDNINLVQGNIIEFVQHISNAVNSK